MRIKLDPNKMSDEQLRKSIVKAEHWAIQMCSKLTWLYSSNSMDEKKYEAKTLLVKSKLAERLNLLQRVIESRRKMQWKQRIEDASPKTDKQLLILELIKKGKTLGNLRKLSMEELITLNKKQF